MDDDARRRTFRTPGWDRTVDIEAGRHVMAGEMSAHTGVGVTALAAPSFRVETELIAAQPAVLGESTTDMGLKRWNIGDFSNLAQAVEVPAGYKLLFTSGLVGQRKDGTLPETPSEQCTQVRFVWLAFNHSSGGKTPRTPSVGGCTRASNGC